MRVTTRTVRLDVDRLRQMGYPVLTSAGHGGGYQLGAGRALPPLLLSSPEAVAVAVGLRLAASSGIDGLDEEALRADYRKIAERRIRLGLLLSEIGRTNNVSVSGEELARAMRQEAARYPGQEQQVLEFFRKNPQAAENLRSPIFEEKVVDFMLELAKVEEKTVSPEELAAAVSAV